MDIELIGGVIGGGGVAGTLFAWLVQRFINSVDSLKDEIAGLRADLHKREVEDAEQKTEIKTLRENQADHKATLQRHDERIRTLEKK